MRHTKHTGPSRPGDVTLPEYRGAVRDLQRLRDQALNGDLAAVHEFGTVVGELAADEDLYGPDAVARAASELGLSPDALYAWARVAQTFTPAQVRAIAVRRRAAAARFEAGHLVALAAVVDPAVRARLVDRVFAECLTVGQLVAATLPPRPPRVRRPPSMRKGLEQIARRTDDLAARLPEWETAVVVELATGPPAGIDPEVVARADAALDAARQLLDRLAEFAGGLEHAIRRGRNVLRLRDAKARQPGGPAGADGEQAHRPGVDPGESGVG